MYLDKAAHTLNTNIWRFPRILKLKKKVIFKKKMFGNVRDSHLRNFLHWHADMKVILNIAYNKLII